MSKTGFKKGRLGIGTDDPVYPLDVVGDIRLTGGFRDGSGNDFNFLALSGPDIVRTTDLADATAGIICKDNSVGIFNNNPSQSLDVSGNIRFTGDLLDSTGQVRIFSNWAISGNDIFRNSKVTIGDASVNTDYNLFVNGNCHIHSTLSAAALSGPLTGNVTGNVTGNCSGSAATVTGTAQTAITSVGILTGLTVSGNLSAGTVSAGTVSATTLSGNLPWSNITSQPDTITTAQAGHIISNNAKVSSQWITTGSDVYRSGGNVGIGTQTPDCKLDVNGIIRASQFGQADGTYFGKLYNNKIYEWSDTSNYLNVDATTYVLADFDSGPYFCIAYIEVDGTSSNQQYLGNRVMIFKGIGDGDPNGRTKYNHYEDIAVKNNGISVSLSWVDGYPDGNPAGSRSCAGFSASGSSNQYWNFRFVFFQGGLRKRRSWGSWHDFSEYST